MQLGVINTKTESYLGLLYHIGGLRMEGKTVTRRMDMKDRIFSEKFCSVKELIDIFSVSESTIKRDLNILENEGLIHRVHGGAFTSGVSGSTDEFDKRKSTNQREKKAIAKVAATLIDDDDLVFLDAGSTIGFMIEYIHSKRIDVYTNSISIINASFVYDLDYKINVMPGELRSKQALILGNRMVEEIQMHHFDKVFVSSGFLDVERGLLTNNYDEFSYKEKLVESAAQIIVCCDSSKIKKWEKKVETIALENIDYLITDNGISNEIVKKFEQQGINTIVLNTEKWG